MLRSFWTKVAFMDFIKHFRKMTAAEIVADIQQSMDDLEDLNPKGSSFGAKMVRWSSERITANSERLQANGRKGGRPRKQQNLEVLVNPSLPGTACGDAAAVTNEAGTAPAGKPFEEARTQRAATTPVPASAYAVPEQGALLPEASTGRGGQISTPVPASASGDAAVGGLLTPWERPETGETLERADAGIRKDPDASATVRAQNLDGDAATREGAEAAASGFATSPSDIQRRPGKSATTSYERPIRNGGSERGADGSGAVRTSPRGEKAEQKLRYGSAGNVLLTATEMGRLVSEFGNVGPLVEEMSDYLLLHPNKYRSHYAALRNWCRRRRQEGRNPDGTRMTQGDRLARHFAEREREILDGNVERE